MENKLVEILESLNLSQEYDVILQGSLDSEDEMPNNYFTYWCWDNARGSYYDNKHSKNLIGYQIVAYSTDRTTLIEMMAKAIEELEKNDFIIEDDETDMATSQPGYTAKTIDIYYMKKKEE